MKIAIIGSNSFLARSIIRLNDSNEIVGLNRHSIPAFDYPIADIGTLDINVLLKSDLVVYCAGGGIQPDHQETDQMINALNFEEPVRLTERLSMEGYSGQLITFGSYFEIGHSTLHKPYAENQLICSNNALPNAYCKSKKKLTSYIANQQVGMLKHLHLVLTNVYGVGENEDRLLPYLARSFKNDDNVSLTSGEQIRQFTHVEDIVKFILDNRTRKLAGIYNFTNHNAVSVKSVIKKFASLASFPNEKLKFSAVSKKDTGMPYLALDTQKIINTHPDFKFKPMIKGLVEYI